MPVARPESSDSRIIAHVDMDCFYVQVEQRKQPELRGLPAAVVQYNEWKGGALIAVGYEARKFGVSRHMRGDEAKEICPQIHLVQVPVARGKADLNTYRNAGSEVVSILSRKGRCERASIDEVYLDLTDSAEAMLMENPPESLEQVDEEALKSHILGLKNENGIDAEENVREWICRSSADHRDKLLACGVLIVAELRMQVLKETEFTCSAGIAHNKMLAKLASGMNKPAQQTVVPSSSVKGLLDSLPIKKMKQLGGKLGTSLQSDLGVNMVGDLVKFSEEKLQNLYGLNTGTWLWNIARGISGEEVQERLLPKSHGSGKSFPGPRALKTIASVQHWLNQLCEELSERICLDLEQNKRTARTLTLHANAYKSSGTDSHKKFPSKSCPLRYGTNKIQEDAFNLFQAGLREYLGSYGVKNQGSNHNKWGVTGLSVSASKIVHTPFESGSILKYFHGQDAPLLSAKQTQDNFIEEAVSVSPAGSESHSEMISTSTQVEHDRPCLGRQEHKRTVWNYQFQDASCSSPKQEQEDIAKETPNVFASGNGNCSGSNQIYSPGKSYGDDLNLISTSGRQKRKTNFLKDKEGTILKFFKTRDSSSASMQEIPGSMYVGDGLPEAKQSEQLKDESIPGANRMNEGRFSSEQNAERGGAWNYKVDDIDSSVIDELPPEIQKEIRVWLWPQTQRQRSIVKRGSSIAHYFLPAKKQMR